MSNSRDLILKPIRRLSPSRYTEMRCCLLREVWTAADNESLLPPSPLAVLGTVIHELLRSAGRGELEGEGNGKIERTWLDLVALAEKKMELSAMQRHQVPLSRSIPDYEVKKLRACHRAAEIARVAIRWQGSRYKQGTKYIGFEVWVESPDGQIGGYIDRATMTPEGVILSDYKSGAVFNSSRNSPSGGIRQTYREQLLLYAALFQLNCGVWPIRLEVVPLQGQPITIPFDTGEAQRIFKDASTFLYEANQRIEEVKNRHKEIIELATPRVANCMLCLFRPMCRAYWLARTQEVQGKWPTDVRGTVIEMTRQHNGKVCIRIEPGVPSTSSCITVRNLTDSVTRHPLLNSAQPGTMVILCGLGHSYHSSDYIETQNTLIFVGQ